MRPPSSTLPTFPATSHTPVHHTDTNPPPYNYLYLTCNFPKASKPNRAQIPSHLQPHRLPSPSTNPIEPETSLLSSPANPKPQSKSPTTKSAVIPTITLIHSNNPISTSINQQTCKQPSHQSITKETIPTETVQPVLPLLNQIMALTHRQSIPHSTPCPLFDLCERSKQIEKKR